MGLTYVESAGIDKIYILVKTQKKTINFPLKKKKPVYSWYLTEYDMINYTDTIISGSELDVPDFEVNKDETQNLGHEIAQSCNKKSKEELFSVLDSSKQRLAENSGRNHSRKNSSCETEQEEMKTANRVKSSSEVLAPK